MNQTTVSFSSASRDWDTQNVLIDRTNLHQICFRWNRRAGDAVPKVGIVFIPCNKPGEPHISCYSTQWQVLSSNVVHSVNKEIGRDIWNYMIAQGWEISK